MFGKHHGVQYTPTTYNIYGENFQPHIVPFLQIYGLDHQVTMQNPEPINTKTAQQGSLVIYLYDCLAYWRVLLSYLCYSSSDLLL